MKTVFEKTRELSSCLLDTEEVKAYLATLDQLEQDDTAIQLLRTQKNLQGKLSAIASAEQSNIVMELQKINLQIQNNPILQKIQDHEKKIRTVLDQVLGILEFSLPAPLFSVSSCGQGCNKKSGGCCAMKP
ncbi:MAG: YlbF family regulator [Epulopiscium sp.]|nr:YlbF family regulator [Candidatus Epulonipiscium sp.]